MNTRGSRRRQATCADLTAQVCQLAELIKEAPPGKLQFSETTEWGAREILIHLVFWHQQYVRIIENLLVNKKPPLLRGSFKSINAQCVSQYRSCTTEELVTILVKTQRELAFLAPLESTKDLRFSFREGSKKWAFPEFINAITRHIRNHRLQMEKLVTS